MSRFVLGCRSWARIARLPPGHESAPVCSVMSVDPHRPQGRAFVFEKSGIILFRRRTVQAATQRPQ